MREGSRSARPSPFWSMPRPPSRRSEEHTSELQSHLNLVCRLLLEKKNVHVDVGCVEQPPPLSGGKHCDCIRGSDCTRVGPFKWIHRSVCSKRRITQIRSAAESFT